MNTTQNKKKIEIIKFANKMIYSQKLKNETSNFLNEKVLSLDNAGGMISKESESYCDANAGKKYSKTTNSILFTPLVVLQPHTHHRVATRTSSLFLPVHCQQ